MTPRAVTAARTADVALPAKSQLFEARHPYLRLLAPPRTDHLRAAALSVCPETIDVVYSRTKRVLTDAFAPDD